MSVDVHHEPKSMADLPQERCCACQQRTRYWYGKGALNVALCQECAAKLAPADIPTRAQWMAGATAKSTSTSA